MRKTASAPGFALMIAITLVAFIMLLLVSFTTLTHLEIKVESDEQLQAEARQNALFALNVALAQLQEYAGSDQRITATAALGEPDADGGTGHRTSRNGLVAPKNGARHWTGVWGNANAPQTAYTAAPTPVLLNWLVSGNENVGTVTVAIDGHITSPTNAANSPFKPDHASMPQPNASGLGEWGLLVGKGTVADTSDYVLAPLQTIPATAATTINRYAWWVGDEGVKARINLRDRHATGNGLSEPGSNLYRLSVAQRSGIEQMDGLAGYSQLINSGQLDQLLANEHTLLADFDPMPSQNALKQRFHDITLHSQGLLTDSLRGGLRKDLTYYLANDLPGLPTKVLPDSSSAFPGANDLKGPTWALVKSFHDQVVSAASGTLAAVAGTDSLHNIAPVIVQVRTRIDLRIDTSGRCFLLVNPVIVLGNPYNVPLVCSSDMYFRYFNNESAKPSLSIKLFTNTNADGSGGDPTPAFEVTVMNSTRTNTLLSPVVLKLPEALVIAPGEVKILSVAADASLPSTTANPPASFQLAEGIQNNVLTLDTGITLPPTAFSTPETTPGAGNGTERHMALRADNGGHFYFGLFGTTTFGSPYIMAEKVGMMDVKPTVGFLAPELPLTNEVQQFYATLRHQLLMPEDAKYSTDDARQIYTKANIRARRQNRPAVFNSDYRHPIFNGGWTDTNEMTAFADLERWGASNSASKNGKTSMVLFDFKHLANGISPTLATGTSPFLSLSALSHADLTADAAATSTVIQPAYAVGNAWAAPYVARNASTSLINGVRYYDTSYLLNTALWDEFFFSALPQHTDANISSEHPLPNGRLRPVANASATDLQDGRKAAANLSTLGAFNINSTSVNAWKALLASLRFAPGDTRYPRTLHQPGGGSDSANGINDNAYNGFRKLSDDEIAQLAEEIVDQVRKRGPFLSLSHFINRTLTESPLPDDSETTATRLGLKGALQTALDNTINSGFPDSENYTTLSSKDKTAFATGDPHAALGHKSTAIPGWLTQADLLQSLGPVLSARSDTFLIRAYGEVLRSDGQTVEAKAWCEAVVQRIVEPIYRKSNTPSEADYNEPSTSEPDFGRRFRVISFRWLSPDDV